MIRVEEREKGGREGGRDARLGRDALCINVRFLFVGVSVCMGSVLALPLPSSPPATTCIYLLFTCRRRRRRCLLSGGAACARYVYVENLHFLHAFI